MLLPAARAWQPRRARGAAWSNSGPRVAGDPRWGSRKRREEDSMDILVPDIRMVEKVLRTGVDLRLPAGRLPALRQAAARPDVALRPRRAAPDQQRACRTRSSATTTRSGAGSSAPPRILVLNAVVACVTFRFQRVDRVVEHSPTMLVRHGRFSAHNLRRERLALRDLRARSCATRRGLAAGHPLRHSRRGRTRERRHSPARRRVSPAPRAS